MMEWRREKSVKTVIVLFIVMILFGKHGIGNGSSGKTGLKDVKTDEGLLVLHQSSILSDSARCLFHSRPQRSYAEMKNQVKSIRDSIKLVYLAEPDSACKARFVEDTKMIVAKMIVDDLIPFWYGTKWSFEGHTRIPGSGTVACGYFVSTILQDAGFILNRYKLAQAGPETEAYTINVTVSPTILEDPSVQMVKDFFSNEKDGLYFVGLDFHVGFVWNEKRCQYFIHSNYIGSTGVVIEEIGDSEAFLSSHYFISRISENERLIKNWIVGDEIKILKQETASE